LIIMAIIVFFVYLSFEKQARILTEMAVNGTKPEDLLNRSKNFTMSSIIFMSGIVFLSGLSIVLFIKKVTKAISRVTVQLNTLANKKLDLEFNDKDLLRNDEIGDIARSTQNLAESLKSAFSSIKESVDDLSQKNNTFNTNFEQITQSVEEINVAVNEMAKGNVQQVKDVEIVNSDVHSLNDVIAKEINITEQLTESANEVSVQTEVVNTEIGSLVEKNADTINEVKEVKLQVQKTASSVNEIKQALEMISSITSQTRLLSLNASIESARAGEAGRGFSVVAGEIGKLAIQSQDNTVQINDIAELLMKNAQDSVESMEKIADNIKNQSDALMSTSEAFEQLRNSTNAIKDIVHLLDAETKVLNNMKTSVVDAINSLAGVCEENTASGEETSASMTLVAGSVVECKEMVDQLIELQNNINIPNGKPRKGVFVSQSCDQYLPDKSHKVADPRPWSFTRENTIIYK